MNYMASATLTIRIDPEMKAELDAVAAARDRDRSYLVKEALREYLEVQKWHMEHLQQGLREADAGEYVSEAKMKKTIARLTRRS
jgi:predicted transcriptional regulator